MTNNHAIVIGGSMAGLVVARILSDRFLTVTLIERDQFPEEAIPRKGTPQSRHIHVLLLQGQLILEKFFPGLREEMIAAGAHLIDVAADMMWLNPAGWGVRFPSDLFILSFSRDLLDWKVRCRLAAINNIRFLQRCEVTGVLSNTGSTCVAGVSVRHHQQSHQGVCEEEQLDADLVVDATGRTSKAPRWLEGQPPSLLTRLMHRYIDEVVQLTTNNAEVRLALLEVMHMLKPPTTLFQPRIVIQVLRRLFKLSFVFPARTSHSQQIG